MIVVAPAKWWFVKKIELLRDNTEQEKLSE